MLVKEVAKKIRKKLKEEKITCRQVNVRSEKCCYSSQAVQIFIKDLSVSRKEIENIAYQFQKINRNKYSGEIIPGNNIFIDVFYDPDVLEKHTNKKLDIAEKIILKYKNLDEGVGVEIGKNDTFFINYYPKKQSDLNELIGVYKRPKEYEKMLRYKIEKIEEYEACNSRLIANALVIFEHQYNIIVNENTI